MQFISEPDQLTVVFQGAEIFLSLKRKMVIPRSSITRLEWLPQYNLAERLFRLIGSDIPNVLFAGRFSTGHRRYFLYLSQVRGWTLMGNVQLQNVLIINTHDFRYDQVLLNCDPEIGASLMNW